MQRITLAQLREWHENERENFDALGRSVSSSLHSLLTQQNLAFLSISYRVKDIDSFLKKARKKRYRDARAECTDILGVRIITYIESDVDRVAEIIRSTFQIDDTQSPDKRAQLEVDRVGYRSLHLVASLGPQRLALPEFKIFEQMLFELQVRSVLQHAWAEIEHDRNYKLPSALPPELKRRLYLVAGILEIADREFNALAMDIDKYSASVTNQTQHGNLDISLNTPSLLVLLNSLRPKFTKSKVERHKDVSHYDDLTAELKDFGLSRLDQVSQLFTENFLNAYDRDGNETTDHGILRDAMMYSDFDRYMKRAWKNRWSWTEAEDLKPLQAKYGDRIYGEIANRDIVISEHPSSLEDLEPKGL